MELLQAEITRIDAQNGVVSTSSGELRPDFLVIARASLNIAAIPGLEAAAHTFYTLDEAVKLHQALEAFEGGEVVLLIPRAPFKCPPAPYEAAMLLQADFSRRGISANTRLSVYTVEGAPMATAGPQMGALVREQLAGRGIGFHPQKKTLSADASERRIHFEDGSQASYDLLIAIPPHEAPPVVHQAGLVAQSGWIPVDPPCRSGGPDREPDRVALRVKQRRAHHQVFRQLPQRPPCRGGRLRRLVRRQHPLHRHGQARREAPQPA